MYAHLSAPPLASLLTELCVSGRTAVWHERPLPPVLRPLMANWPRIEISVSDSASPATAASSDGTAMDGIELRRSTDQAFDQLIAVIDLRRPALPRAVFRQLQPGGLLVELGRPGDRWFRRLIGLPPHPRRTAAIGQARVCALSDAGFYDLQQWMCVEPADWLVTLARPRIYLPPDTPAFV